MTTYKGYEVTVSYSEPSEFLGNNGGWTCNYAEGLFASEADALAAGKADIDAFLVHPNGHVFANKSELDAYKSARDAGDVDLARKLACY